VPDLSAVAAELDAAIPERVLVYGSLPGRASDLDLLVRPAARAALQAWLPSAGFRRLPAGWVRVGGGLTAVVDLADVADWDLPADQVADLFDRAVPLDGMGALARPAPRHALLVLARRVQACGGRLGHRQLARARQALVEDPDALEAAEALAPAWACAGALEVLAADLRALPLETERRRRLLADDGVPPPARWRAAAAALPRTRDRRGVVVAVSGLDGSGKSTLTAGVVDALDGLGLEPVVLWHRISYGRALRVLAAPAKGAQRVVQAARGRRRAPVPVPAAPGPAAAADPAAAEEAPVSAPSSGGVLWPVVVTLVHVLTAGTITRWHLRRGRTVVRDRYVLDALVHVLHRYGDAAPERLHRLLLSRLQPRPLVAVLLDVPAEVAYRRKREFGVEHLARQRELYLRHHAPLGVARLDGTAPPHVLHEQVVSEVLAALTRQGRHPGTPHGG
jgi:thymidylate kinase